MNSKTTTSHSTEIQQQLSMISEEETIPETEKDEDTSPEVSPRNTLNELTAKQWLPETKSFWYQKGLGRNHPEAQFEKMHPAPFSFQDVGRLIAFFTKTGSTVLDPFVGVGSTLKACAVLERKGIGIELSEEWSRIAHARLEAEVSEEGIPDQLIVTGDSRVILDDNSVLPNDSVDMIVTSPPYWGILNKKADHKVKTERIAKGRATNYGDDVKDLGNIEDYDNFLDELTSIFMKCQRSLRKKGALCVVVSDFRHKSRFYPFHSDLYSRLLNHPDSQLELQGITTLLQNHKRLFPYGYPTTYVQNIHHQYIIILRKKVS